VKRTSTTVVATSGAPSVSPHQANYYESGTPPVRSSALKSSGVDNGRNIFHVPRPAKLLDQPQPSSDQTNQDISSSGAAYRWLSAGPSVDPPPQPFSPHQANYYNSGAPPVRSSAFEAGGLYSGVDNGRGYFQLPRPTRITSGDRSTDEQDKSGQYPRSNNFDTEFR